MNTEINRNQNNLQNLTNITEIDFGKLIDEKNDIVIKIFDHIKKHEWDKVYDIIKMSNIDLNIKDVNGTYLLEYIVIFNQIKLIDLVLEKGIRLDIVDESSRSFLFGVIKFSHTEILLKVLEKNKNSIGKSILEIKDNLGNIPLFYSIKFYNIECVKLILRYTSNFYIKNNDGDNALHLSIKSQNYELFRIILENFNDFKSRNNIGESYLHLIIKYKCYDMLNYLIENFHSDTNFIQMLNFIDYKYNFSILHYICVGMDFESLNIISKSNLAKFIDGNIQDKSGNIFYHYFINNIIKTPKPNSTFVENIIGMNEIFKKITFNINLYNIDGNTPAHLFFSSIEYFSTNKFNILINWIGEKANMNIQNFEGESVFYLIVKNNYWKQIYNILITKKIDTFVIASDSSIVFDFINKTDYEYFVRMITHSYLHQISNSSTSKKWLDYWDNRCKKIVKYNDLNETELELLKNLGINYNEKEINYDKNICFDVIEKKLDKLIKIFISSKKQSDVYEYTSYPITHKFKKLISLYPNVVISTFSGSTIDVFSGIIYLLKKFNEGENKYLISSLIFIENKNDVIECKTTKSSVFENKSEQEEKICEITGFELLWINKNIYFPSSEYDDIETILKKILGIKYIDINSNNSKKNQNTTDKKYDWFIIPIGIEIYGHAHANYLIIDLNKLEIEIG